MVVAVRADFSFPAIRLDQFSTISASEEMSGRLAGSGMLTAVHWKKSAPPCRRGLLVSALGACFPRTTPKSTTGKGRGKNFGRPREDFPSFRSRDPDNMGDPKDSGGRETEPEANGWNDPQNTRGVRRAARDERKGQ